MKPHAETETDATNSLSLDQAIQHVIAHHEIQDQSTFLALLAKEGFHLTQGTLSRRLAKLNIGKWEGRYVRVIPRDLPRPPYSIIESPPNLLVLNTGPGFSVALAIRLDRHAVPGIAGTLAGENTVFVALSGDRPMEEVSRDLVKLLGPPVASP